MDYALLVGINKYASAPLSGCVNDVLDMADLLVSVYGFLPQNIRMLVDERATTAAIKERLEWLVSGLKAGDRLVFHFSGHGTQVVTRNKKQELDGLDECICPFDFDWTDERMIRDKDFAKLFARIPPSVNFVWLSDSCHSGDLQRDLAPPLREGRVLGVRHYPKPVDIAWREKGAQSLGLDFLYPFKTYKDRGPLLLSGCKSDQTSADASFTGRANGAFTYYLIKELKAAAEAESPVELPLSQLVARIQQSMKHAGFRQEPQLVGPPARTSRPFLK
jgi:hypothetical protein